MAQTQHLSSLTGVEAVVSAVSAYEIAQGADGLEFASPSDSPQLFDGVKLSERLLEFLTDIRLLRRIPLSYLVPDAGLLPPESIRFFYVNQTWVDRVIDGVVSNTNLGTVDFHRSLTVLQMIREQVNPAAGQMTGMLIRSELVKRWPKMIVRAFSSPNASADAESTMTVLRAEPISRDVFIALFDGTPARVHLREPFDGVRYGVEFDGQTHTVDRRNPNGSTGADAITITFHNTAKRTLDIGQLAAEVGDPRAVALHLEQRPYVQVFRRRSTAESTGSQAAPPFLKLHNGTQIPLTFAPQSLTAGGSD